MFSQILIFLKMLMLIAIGFAIFYIPDFYIAFIGKIKNEKVKIVLIILGTFLAYPIKGIACLIGGLSFIGTIVSYPIPTICILVVVVTFLFVNKKRKNKKMDSFDVIKQIRKND